MKYLIIGGTYFLGKEFARQAAEDPENEIYFINRGSKLSELSQEEREHTFVMDRHDATALSEVKLGRIDVIVDFCAYQPGDIRLIVENLGSSFGRYIFVSTTDVYKRGTGCDPITESAEFETRDFGGEAGSYILGKVALEEEVKQLMAEYGIKAGSEPEDYHESNEPSDKKAVKPEFTVVRPAFIYGPENYAPREGIYFNWILRAGQILSPVDSDGYYQMAYVEDAAAAILLCCKKKEAANRAFNVCGPQRFTYEMFEGDMLDVMKGFFGISAVKVPVEISVIEEKGIPLPFPLRSSESEYYDCRSILELTASFRSLFHGLKETAAWYLKNEKK